MANTHATDDRFPTDTLNLPAAERPEVLDPGDGGWIDLRIAPVTKQLGGATVRMLAYSGSIPGPTLRVRQGTTLFVNVLNDGDLDATVHWHGLRLDNQFDGTASTQPPIPPGGRFTYRLTFPDPGIYWYHPHIREDYTQEMGLYGTIIVVPSDPDYWPPVDREVSLTLDDILIESGRVAPFSRHHPTYTAMGRFGNVLLVNGESDFSLAARQGEVVRFYLTNTANARVFNLAMPGARLKIVGGDSGRCERETFVATIVIAPSERVVVDARFEEAGTLRLEHRTPNRIYTLASVQVRGDAAFSPSPAGEFGSLRHHPDFQPVRVRLTEYLDAEPDRTLALVAEMDMGADDPVAGTVIEFACPMHPDVRRKHAERCPRCGMKLLPAHMVAAAETSDHMHEHGAVETDVPGGIEWEDDMIDVNRITTPANMRWKLVDRATGAEGAAIDWRFRVGEMVKIRLVNETDSDHPMHHPFHIHGAGRFLILSRDGVPESNLVWKDTVLIPTGQTVDILLAVTNPGVWMAHCHIAEHHESGMLLTFRVEPQGGER